MKYLFSMSLLRKNLLVIPLLILSLFSQAQNLVPNFSFEQNDTCPNSEDQIQYAIGWSKFSAAGTTPDYYNSCSPSTSFGVPYSIFTHQEARRNCNAYSGLVTFASPLPDYREYIGIQLNQPLIVGQEYFISFYTVMSESFLGTTQYGMPSNNIGIRLSTVLFNSNSPCLINNFAHLSSSTIINDSTNWNLISGSLIADSAYSYIIIGNFFDDLSTDTLHYNCASCLNHLSYYLIDDVCLSTDSLLCNGGLDKISCDVLIAESFIYNDQIVFPNPFSDYLNISLGRNHFLEIEIYTVLGEIIFKQVVNSKIKINLSYFPTGPYLLKIFYSENNKTVVKKIIKL